MFHLVAAEEHSVLLPASYDIIWGGVSFLIILTLFGKFVLPRMRELSAQRIEKIEGGLKRAEQSQEQAGQILEQYRSQLEHARMEAGQIRKDAEAERNSLLERAKAEASAAQATIADRAHAALEAERSGAAAALQREVSTLALNLAERILGESLSDDVKARAAVDRFISELEQAR